MLGANGRLIARGGAGIDSAPCMGVRIRAKLIAAQANVLADDAGTGGDGLQMRARAARARNAGGGRAADVAYMAGLVMSSQHYVAVLYKSAADAGADRHNQAAGRIAPAAVTRLAQSMGVHVVEHAARKAACGGDLSPRAVPPQPGMSSLA